MKNYLRLAGFFLLICTFSPSYAQVQWEYLSEPVSYSAYQYVFEPTVAELEDQSLLIGYDHTFYRLSRDGQLAATYPTYDQINKIKMMGDHLMVAGKLEANCNLFFANYEMEELPVMKWNTNIIVEQLSCNYLQFICSDFFQTNDGAILLIGSRIPQEPCMGHYIPTIKLDNQGNLIWNRQINDQSNESKVTMQATDNNFYFVPIPNTILKSDEEGNKKWEKRFLSRNINSILKRPNGNCLLAGNFHDSNNLFFYNWLALMNPEGGIIWEKTWPGDGINKIIAVSNNEFLAIGGGEDGFISKINTSGDVIWDRHVEGSPGYQNVFLDIIPSDDQGWIITGMQTLKVPLPNHGILDHRIWIVKYHSYDCLAPDCDGTPVKTITYKDQEKEVGPEAFNIYPNPFNDLTTIASPYKEATIQYQLYSMQGVMIETGTVQAGYASKDWSHLAPGVYLLEWHGKYNHGKTRIIRQ